MPTASHRTPTITLAKTLALLPTPSQKRIALRVTPEAQRWIAHGHPWLFDQAIRSQSHVGAPGDLAVIFDDRNRFLAIGLYDPASPIRVRMLQACAPAPIDRRWFETRLSAALDRREPLHRAKHTTGYRLVHGENDGLPGLVIDRYADTLVVKLYTAAWLPHLREVLGALNELWSAERLVLRLARAVPAKSQSLGGLRDGMILDGPPIGGALTFLENGLRFEVDPIRGQKTGFFLDQRDNRARLERVTRGAQVLDVFAYTGGFAVYAARGGAREITSIDATRLALEVAARNLALNQQVRAVAKAAHRVIVGDVFDVLERLRKAQRRFDIVILDPPAFATAHHDVKAALTAYERLSWYGARLVRAGGILVSSSCSGHVAADRFFATVHRAAHRAGRRLTELERTGHPLDHPVGFPEGAYLKCLFAGVEDARGLTQRASTKRSPV